MKKYKYYLYGVGLAILTTVYIKTGFKFSKKSDKFDKEMP
jgi:hypothetical protein